jgi:Type II CAAX prenyl endopeptidase Rce1-like
MRPEKRLPVINDKVARLRSLLVVVVLMLWPLLFSEQQWWAFIPATAAIMASLRLLHGRQWTTYAGLKMPLTHVVLAVVVFGLVATGTKTLLPHIYESTGLRAEAPRIEQQLGLLFQSLNEEILFRGLLIGLLLQYMRSKALISVGLACIFSSAHFLLYRFANPLHVALSWTALLTLFLAGAAMNNLYLTFRHVGFSWALHAGWNIVWLPAAVYDAVTHDRLHEPQVFDRILGAPAIAAVAGGTAFLSFGLLALRSRRPSRVNYAD